MFANPLAQVALISIISILSQWLGWRLKIPAIVFLLLSGFLLGSIFPIVQPDILFGDTLQPLVSVAVGIILFEGSLTLNFKEIKQGRKTLRQIVFIGGPIAWLLTSYAAHYLGGLSWPVAIPFGALLIVTGPTVIMPLLRHARLNTRVGSILKWEGIINDPFGAVLAILAYEYFITNAQTGVTLSQFGLETGIVILGISALSIVSGFLIAGMLNRGWVPEFLKAPFLLCVVISLFVICNSILHESGLIAVTLLGIVMANRDITSIDDLRRFKESITIMLVSGVFVVLTANIKPEILLNIDWRGFLFVFVLLFVVRPITIALSSFGTGLTLKEIGLISYIAPRGVVCAAIAGILGPLLVKAGYPDGEKLLPLAFAIVLTTVFLHGLTAKPLAQRLGLAFPSKDGLIIVGAMNWTIQLAETMKKHNVDVMIADKDWPSLRKARLADIPIYYGEVLSEETDHALELSRYNILLATTGNAAYNALVCNKFAHEFGRERVFQLSTNDENEDESRQITHTMRGRTLAYEGMDCWDFERLFQQGWRFRTTKISAEYNLNTIKEEKKQGRARLIGIISDNGNIKISDADHPKNLKDGTVFILFTPQDDVEKNVS